MQTPQKAVYVRALPLFAAIALSLSMLAPTLAMGAAVVAYEKESQQQYEHQLSAGEIQEAVFNKKIRSLHIILKDGRHLLYHYPAKDEPTLDAQLTGKGVAVTILAPPVASKEATKPAKHKLRYIAGGVLVVIVIIVVAVLYIDRKRKAERE